MKQSKARGAMFSMWYGNVFNTIEERLLSAALKLVERDRLGEVIDPGLVASVCNSFVNYELGNHEAKRYREVYEAKYIQCCVDFYQPRATQVSERYCARALRFLFSLSQAMVFSNTCNMQMTR